MGHLDSIHRRSKELSSPPRLYPLWVHPTSYSLETVGFSGMWSWTLTTI